MPHFQLENYTGRARQMLGFNGQDFEVKTKYSEWLVASMHACGGTWNPDEKTWTVPPTVSNVHCLLELATGLGLEADGAALAAMQEVLSTASSAVLPQALADTLHDYQRAGVEFAVRVRDCMIADEMGTGKMNFVNCKVLTPSGWKRLGDIRRGDKIFGQDGLPHTVTGYYPQGILPSYKLTFRDGSTTECGAEHLWAVKDANRLTRGENWTVKTLAELMKWGIHTKQGANKWCIPLVEPIQFEPKSFIIDPYILGVLIGDGCLLYSTPNFSNPDIDNDIAQRVLKRLPAGCVMTNSRRESCPNYRLTFASRRNEIRAELVRLGLDVHSEDKFIPGEYLLGSVQQRLDLLRGLMDTDGSARKNRITFHTTAYALAVDVAALVRSLGGTAIVRTYDRTKDGKGIEYQVNVRLHLCPFYSRRKSFDWQASAHWHRVQYLQSVEPAGDKEQACISVDSPGGLYVTDDYIVTHNTLQAIAAVETLRAYPAYVVCPSCMKLTWEMELHRWLPGRSVRVLSGYDGRSDKDKADWTILNYDILGKGKRGPKLNARGKVRLVTEYPLADALETPAAVVFDESHYAKNTKAHRTKAAIALARRATQLRLALTGTPVLSRPLDLVGQLHVINQFTRLFGSWPAFTNRYCCPKTTPWGIDYRGASNLQELSTKLFATCVIRRTKAEVLSELPDKQRVAVLLDMPKALSVEYRHAKQNLIDYLRKHKGNDAASRASNAEAIAKLTTLQGILAKGKYAPAHEWIEDFLETGQGLVVFGQRRGLLDDLHDAFKGSRMLTGDIKTLDRQRNIEAFQAGKCKLLLCQMQAAGVGITLTAASNCLFLELPWNPATVDQAEARLHRIGQANSVTAWFLVFRGTLDEVIMRALKVKQKTIGTVLGERDDGFASLLREIEKTT